MDDQNKNLILATVLSAIVLLVWFLLFPPEQQAPGVAQTDTNDGIVTATDGGAITPPVAPGTTPPPGTTAAPEAATGTNRETALAASDRIQV
ncbi:MAG: membrane protein insertase YidC, partial [Jannaschia sp.]